MDLEHERRLAETEARSKSNMKRIDEVVKRQEQLASIVNSINIIADRQERMSDDIAGIREQVDTMEAKPGKKWESLGEKVLWAIVAAVITYVLAKIGIA